MSEKRSGFLTGWFSAESGESAESNPYDPTSLKHSQFQDGWREYHTSLKNREAKERKRANRRKRKRKHDGE